MYRLRNRREDNIKLNKHIKTGYIRLHTPIRMATDGGEREML